MKSKEELNELSEDELNEVTGGLTLRRDIPTENLKVAERFIPVTPFGEELRRPDILGEELRRPKNIAGE